LSSGQEIKEGLQEKSEAFRQKYLLEPATIDQAVPVSCWLLFGGFSRRSVIRLKAFDVYKSPSWAVFFLLVTIANSIYISILPELLDKGTEVSSFSVGPPKAVTWLDSVDIASAIVLLFEVSVGSIALGFFGESSSHFPPAIVDCEVLGRPPRTMKHWTNSKLYNHKP
jgi:hypothetical protein